MPPALRTAYIAIFALAMLYFLCVHAFFSPRRTVSTGAEGSGCRPAVRLRLRAPAWTAANGRHRGLLPASLLFAALCWLNCTAIEAWEGGRPQRIQLAASILALAAAAAAGLAGLAVIGSAVAVSALLLLSLDRTRLPAGRLRILADLALLTPLVALLTHAATRFR